MTVATTNITDGPFTGNGVTTAFGYTFRIEDEAQIIVYETDTAGAVTTLTLTTDYTVSGVGSDAGGSITRVAGALPSGYTWYLRSNYALTQSTKFRSQGRFLPEVHEAAFDKLSFIVQQLLDLNNRAFRVAASDPDASAIVELPNAVTRADKTLAFDSAGDLIVTGHIGQWVGDWVTATVYLARDLYKDPADSNVYTVLADHTSTTVAADVISGYVELLIDSAAAATSAAAALVSENNAAADLVLTNADVVTAEDSNLESGDWANQTEDALARTFASGVPTNRAAGNYSALHWAAKAAANVVLTNADVVLTNADVTATNADVVTVAGIYDNFDDRYLGAKASAPTLDNDGNALLTGALYFDSTTNTMQVYNGTGWQDTTSSVPGLTQTFTYTATASQTLFTGADDNALVMAFDGSTGIQVFLNGVKQILNTDFTSGTNAITLLVGATVGDLLELSAFSFFTAADTYTQAQINAKDALKIDTTEIGTSVQAYDATLETGATKTSRKNAVINGNFDHWQRSTSQLTTGGGLYTADRWKSTDGTGTVTASRQTFTLGQTDVPGNPTYFHRYDMTVAAATANASRILHRIEGVSTFAGETVTLSLYMKASSAISLGNDASSADGIELSQSFGTGGSPSTSVSTTLSTGTSITTSWVKHTFTVTLPSITGKTLGTAGDDYLELRFDCPYSVYSFDIAQVQLEKGSVATDFERRTVGEELQLCYRYYWERPGLSVVAGAASTALLQTQFSLPSIMRVSPTFDLTSFSSGGSLPTPSAVDSTAIRDHWIRVSLTVTGATSGACGLVGFDLTADGEL
tara:strand:- start:16253 stop:18679 length:2427 start_codon:yes stop_codon:yes gene_type:complete